MPCKKLTPRQKEILHWICLGKTNGEIAIILRISPATVKTHVEQVLARLGMINRTVAAVWCATERQDDEDDRAE